MLNLMLLATAASNSKLQSVFVKKRELFRLNNINKLPSSNIPFQHSSTLANRKWQKVNFHFGKMLLQTVQIEARSFNNEK